MITPNHEKLNIILPSGLITPILVFTERLVEQSAGRFCVPFPEISRVGRSVELIKKEACSVKRLYAVDRRKTVLAPSR